MTTETAKRTRRWPRYHLDIPIRVIVHGPGKTRVIVGRGNELNDGGMSLTAGVELKPGDQAEIEFNPPYAGVPIRIRGVVRNRKGYRYGMEFVAESDHEEEQVLGWRTMLGVLSTN
jgi:hypothetical protein